MEITSSVEQALKDNYVISCPPDYGVYIDYASKTMQLGLPFIAVELYGKYPLVRLDLIYLEPFRLSDTAVNEIADVVRKIPHKPLKLDGRPVSANQVLSYCYPRADFALDIARTWFKIALEDLNDRYPDRSLNVRDALALKWISSLVRPKKN